MFRPVLVGKDNPSRSCYLSDQNGFESRAREPKRVCEEASSLWRGQSLSRVEMIPCQEWCSGLVQQAGKAL